MRKIINLTQHETTDEQRELVFTVPGIYDQDTNTKETLSDLLTFKEIPTQVQMDVIARKLAIFAVNCGAHSAMIGGAPFFMSTLERHLKACGVQPLYAFSVRESFETIKEDGSVVKVNVFKHKGFVTV